jgi:MFS family permease
MMSAAWYRTLDADARRAFWASFAGFTLDAMDVQLYAFVLPVLLTLWGLSHADAGLLASVTLGASALGGWLAGVLADRLGRVRLLQFSILWLAIATSLCGLSANFSQLLVARALQGFGFGGEWAVGAVFVAEVAAPHLRGRMVGTVQSAWAVGWGLAALNATLALSLLPPELGWRATFLVGLVPALAVFLVRRKLREPRPFLRARRHMPWHAIFSGQIRASTLKGSLLAIGMHGGYWAIASWWPTVLRSERGLSSAASGAYFASLVLGSFFGYLCAARLGDSVGRRATLGSFAMCGAVLVLICTELPCSDLALFALGFPLGFFALGMFAVIGPVLTELYPTELRGSGMGFCYNFGRGMAGLTPFLIGVGADRGGIAHSLGLYVAGAYGLVVLAVLVLPETSGREPDRLPESAP